MREDIWPLKIMCRFRAFPAVPCQPDSIGPTAKRHPATQLFAHPDFLYGSRSLIGVRAFPTDAIDWRDEQPLKIRNDQIATRCDNQPTTVRAGNVDPCGASIPSTFQVELEQGASMLRPVGPAVIGQQECSALIHRQPLRNEEVFNKEDFDSAEDRLVDRCGAHRTIASRLIG